MSFRHIIWDYLKNKMLKENSINHQKLATLILLIGQQQEMFLLLKIKDNVDLAGLSPPQDQWNLASWLLKN